MKTSLKLVTPEMAAEWLGKNIRNRKQRLRGSMLYANEIREGRWLVHHQGIAIEEGGRLVDGQHRLQAILDTGISVPLNVTINMPRGSMDAVDRGMTRTLPDVLRLEHEVDHAQRIVAIAGLLAPIVADYTLRLSAGMAMTIYRAWKPEIDWASTLPSNRKLWQAAILTAFCIAHRREPEAIEKFADAYRRAEVLREGEPLHYLYTQVLGQSRTKKMKRDQVVTWVLAILHRHINGQLIESGIRGDDSSGFDFFVGKKGGDAP